MFWKCYSIPRKFRVYIELFICVKQIFWIRPFYPHSPFPCLYNECSEKRISVKNGVWACLLQHSWSRSMDTADECAKNVRCCQGRRLLRWQKTSNFLNPLSLFLPLAKSSVCFCQQKWNIIVILRQNFNIIVLWQTLFFMLLF